MKDWIDDTLGRALATWTDVVRRRAVVVVAAAAAAAAASLLYAAGHLGINADTDAMLSDELPFRRLVRDFDEALPILKDNLVVVVDASSAEGAREAAESLAEALRSERHLFPSVFVPGGGSFFTQHGLLYLDVNELEDLADQLARVQPFLGELAHDPSLRGLFGLLEQALEADVELRRVDLAAVFERVASAAQGAAGEPSRPLAIEDLLLGDAMGDSEPRRLVLAKPAVDFSEFLPARVPMDRVHAIAEELELESEHGADVRITGSLALSTEELTVVRDQAAAAGVASFVLVVAILFLALGSLRLVLATVMTLLVGLCLTVGFAAMAIGHLNIVSVAFAVLFIGLAVDFAIHLSLRYRELLAAGRASAEALREASSSVGSSLVLCAVTTAIGFYAFLPTGYSGVAELGLISGTGMFLSLIVTLTLLPALLSLTRGRQLARESRRLGGVVPRLPRLPLRHPVSVRIGALLLAAAALLTLPALRFDANPLAVRDPGTESVRAFHDVMEQGSTALLGIEVLAPDLRTAQTLASRLNDLESVDRTITLADYVPPDQEEKRLILEELSYFLALPPPDREMEPPPNDEVFAAIASLRERLSTLADEESDPRLRASGERLGKALGHFIPEPAAGGEALPLEPLERSLVPPIRNALARLQASLFPGPVTLDSLPSELRRRLETPDGRARIQVFPRADIEDPDAVEAFVDEVRSLTPQAVGEAVVIVESKRAVVGALRQALLAAVVMIGVLLFALWRRLSDTALVLTPLALAALLTCAVSVLADLPLNFADVIVLPLLLGIGVDSGIHLVNRYRHAPAGEERDVLGTSTARAVFWSGLTTVAGFGSLAFATHRGLASLGQLLTAGVALTLICNLVVLPALLTGRSSVGGAAGQGCDGPRSAP